MLNDIVLNCTALSSQYTPECPNYTGNINDIETATSLDNLLGGGGGWPESDELCLF